jgi:hypothetical protein
MNKYNVRACYLQQIGWLYVPFEVKSLSSNIIDVEPNELLLGCPQTV